MGMTALEAIRNIFAAVGVCVMLVVAWMAFDLLWDKLRCSGFGLGPKMARRRRVMRMIKRKLHTGEIIGFDQLQEIKWAYEDDPFLRGRLVGVENLLTYLHYGEEWNPNE